MSGGSGWTATRGLLERLHQLVSTELAPGDQLPSEPELASSNGVSRSSIREALKALEQDGLVYSIRGKGRFVSPLGSVSVERPITRYESTDMMLASLGFEVETAVLDVGEGQAEGRVAEMLGLPVGAPVVELIRLRSAGGQPLVLSLNTLPGDVLPGPARHRD